MCQIKSVILSFILVALTTAVDFKFNLEAGQRECFGDQLPESTLIYGRVRSTTSQYKFDIYFEQVDGDREDMLDSVKSEMVFDFHHVTEFDGEVTMCFEADEYAETQRIFLQYDAGSETHDFAKIAQQGQAAIMNATIHDMELMQMDITREQLRLTEAEGLRNNDYVDVSSKIIGFGGVTFAMLLIVAACQVIYIKRYFANKKLI